MNFATVITNLFSAMPDGTWLILSRIGAAYYFLHFLVVLPVVGRLEKPLPLPISISQSVLRLSDSRVEIQDITTDGA